MHCGKHKAEILDMGVSQSQKLLVICWSLFDLSFLGFFKRRKKLGKKFGDVKKFTGEITLKGEPLLISVSLQILFSVFWLIVRAVKHCSRLPREVCRFSTCGGNPNVTGRGFGQPAVADLPEQRGLH